MLVWAAINVDRVAAVEQALVDLAQSIPLWFDQIYRLAYFGGLLLVVGLVIGVLAQGAKRLDLLRDIVLAIAASLAIAAFLIWRMDGSIPAIMPEFSSTESDFTFPILRVAVLTSAITVASPHLVVQIRRFGWLMVVIVATSGFGLGLGLVGDAGGGFALGLVAGGLILLIFGSPSGYPSRSAVIGALADVGLKAKSVEPEVDRSWGVRRFVGSLDDGTRIDVKVYGRDATDSQYLSRAWQWLWYREGGQTFSSSRLQAVEHEALILLTAGGAGVATPGVRAVGIGGDDMALLVTDDRGRAVTAEDLDVEALAAMWREVALLHTTNIAHGALTLDAVALVDERPEIRNFATASLNPPEVRRILDVVNFLFSTATVVGADVAVAGARAGLGDEQLVAALPYMQSAALSRAQRSENDKPKHVISELRDTIASETGAEVPEQAKLRRVRPKDLIMPLLSLVAAYALINMLTDIDFVAVWNVVSDAAWPLIIIGFVVGQAAFVPEATGMLFATGYGLPLRPLVILQVSVKWIGLAVPSAAGRVTMNTLFLRKYGVTPAVALTQGVLDGLARFVVEAGILVAAFIPADVSINLDTGDTRWGLLFAIIVVLTAVSVVALLRVEKLRTAVLPALKDAWGLLWSLLKDPKRTL
ncbi:MAG: hypothetical protein ACC654_12970, partial [Acidimicrobiia bacterium]